MFFEEWAIPPNANANGNKISGVMMSLPNQPARFAATMNVATAKTEEPQDRRRSHRLQSDRGVVAPEGVAGAALAVRVASTNDTCFARVPEAVGEFDGVIFVRQVEGGAARADCRGER